MFKKITLKTLHTAHKSHLTPVEFDQVVPFKVKRLYYFNVGPGGKTGEHCHKTEQEVFFQVQGSATAIIDRGNGKEEIRLNSPGDAIYLPNFVWHGFKDATPDCLILAVSSTNYADDRSDYIEDYTAYLKIRDAKLR